MRTIHILSLLFALLAIVHEDGRAQTEHMRGKKILPPLSKEWSVNVMENAPQSWGHRWFTMDAFNEELHVLYFHSTETHVPNYLIYGYSPDNGKSWTFDTIDGRPGMMAEVSHTFSIAVFNGAIAVDRCGEPHLFYTVNYFYDQPANPSWAIHAEKINGTWIWDTVEARDATQSMINFDVDMVIGSDDEPRVVYIRGNKESVFAARRGGRWQIEMIRNLEDLDYEAVYYGCNLALDGRNNPQAVFIRSVGLDYAKKSGGEWAIQFAMSEGVYGGDIALDPSGRPHVIFSKSISRPFFHATLGKEGWETYLVESNVISGSANTKRARIKRDAEGRLHAVYYGHNELPEPEYLVYAFSTDSGRTWKEEIVEMLGSDVYTETTYPDIVITDALIGIFYKGEGNMPRFTYKEHSKPHFRKSRKNYCGQDDPQYRSEPTQPTPGDR